MATVEAVAGRLDTVAPFNTPEHVAFRFHLAGPLLRGIAWLIDLIIVVVFLALVGMLLVLLGGGVGLGLWLLFYFLVTWFAGGVCEWVWKGFTPGKRLLGIRVIGSDGLPAGLGACLMRNFMRSVDWMPFGFLLGLGAMCSNRRFQRLGDLAASTVVVHHRREAQARWRRIEDPRFLERAARLPAEVESLLDGEARRVIANYFERRGRFGPGRRNEIAEHLAGPLRDRLGLGSGWGADALLCACYVRCYQETRHGEALVARLLSERRRDWRKLEALVEGSAGARRADERALEMSRRYRNACADLALAEAYHLPPKQVDHLHEIIARAHLAFYPRLQLSLRRLAHAVLTRVPGTLYGDGCTRIAILAFFGVFVAAMVTGRYDGELAASYVGEHQIAEMERSFSVPPRDRDAQTAGMMGGFYVNNNVGIALSCFAAGIFFGIGSLFYLVFNGLFLGLAFGYMGQGDPDIAANFHEFVTAHGPFELTGIALSGGAGMRLGLGLIDRRGLPWQESLRTSARRSLPIALVAATMVALAAPIEAFVSPSDLSLEGKRLVGATCAGMVLVYLVGFGFRGRRILDAEATEGDDGT